MAKLKQFLPHLLVLAGFIILSLFYFNPVLQGKEIYQSDIIQYIGMAKEQNDFRAETGEEPYWTDAAFGGMPTYQLGAYYPHNYVKKLDAALRFLPRPADYLFLYFLGFYILLLCMKVDYKLAFLGSIAFGFSTYLIIILGVGHNAKAHAIAYMPMVLAGIIAIFRYRNIWSFLLLTIAMALEIQANHFQMTYYLLLLVIALGIAYLVDAYRKNILPVYFKSLGIMVIAVVLAVAANATNLLATSEYTQFSTRGESNLSIEPDGSPKQNTGLSFDYITEYSYGILESFNLMVPRFMGGGSSENIGKDSNLYDALREIGASPVQAEGFTESAPTYWGDQPFVGAPAYIGATVIFLFVFALFLIRGRLKWWIVGGSLLALFLSWGKNFEFFTEFFIEFVPLYNKFRAVSSIQVILELCLPLLAVMGLYKLFLNEVKKEEKIYALKWSSIITGGLLLIFLVFKSILFDFEGANDSMYSQQFGMDFMKALEEDRKSIFTADVIRSLIFVLLSAGLLWGYLKAKISRNLVIGGLIIILLVDLIGVDKRYVNEEDFVQAREMKQPFQKLAADEAILEDKGHYRVFDVSGSPFNTGRTSYYHNALGGYHAAKPGRIQELYDFYISNNNMKILSMLNVKYFIVPTEEGTQAQQNPNAYGNAWLVKDIKWVETQDQEMLALEDTDLRSTAVINSKFKDVVDQDFNFEETAKVELISYQPNELKYSFDADAKQFVVFSENYYQPGWQAYIDGEAAEHAQVNYVLRGMNVPAGEHEIVFKFEPEVVKTGSNIALISSILIGLVLLGGIGFELKKRK
ncbi:membrane protein YfhO [Christiangramia gaetbulicola]|uniref:Membrane protein YfhO n=1 Tax=Christiangramia gaetbulicola TaxID=703340 RepID=A0A2T6AGK1_9FLAO|nr:YfhO family protein [Christiangramia gaetbulicola]PTX42926.1 membrane protein YfhO [Christiangramia gaetbulicola]